MSGKKSKNKKIVYGNVELDADEFDPRYVKLRVTTFIDLDVVDALKKKAKISGTKYQTLLNQILRDEMIEKKESKETQLTETSLRKILREELKKTNQ